MFQNYQDQKSQFIEAHGNILANENSERSDKKSYSAITFIDQLGDLCASTRAIETFDLDPSIWGVNVRPYSSSPVNFAI